MSSAHPPCVPSSGLIVADGPGLASDPAPADLLRAERAHDLERAKADQCGDRKQLIRQIEIENTRVLVDQVIANAKARRKLRVGQHREWRDRVEQRTAAMRMRRTG